MNLTVFLYTTAEKIVFLYCKLFNKEEIADISFRISISYMRHIYRKEIPGTSQIMQRRSISGMFSQNSLHASLLFLLKRGRTKSKVVTDSMWPQVQVCINITEF